jgi:Icc-related predicted phosphoesterase
MKALYTSDIHGDLDSWKAYAVALGRDEYDFGLLGGDLTDDGLTPEQIAELTDDRENLNRTNGGDGESDPAGARELLLRAVERVETIIKEMLRATGKPVYLIPGNHDISGWSDDDGIINIHGQRVERAGTNIVGYRYSELDRSAEEHEDDIAEMASLVDARTILITHRPRFGVLDATSDGTHIGSPQISRLVNATQPLFHLCGHVHESPGIDGWTANGAYVTGGAFVEVDVDARTLRMVR